MKRFIILTATLCFAQLLATPLLAAHILKTDGQIGAILHVNPDDAPQAGIATSYILSFTDKTNHFSLQHCDCTATVTDGSTVIANQRLDARYAMTVIVPATFPKPAVYQLVVNGKPQAGANFQTFQLSYTIRVEGDAASFNRSVPLAWIGLAVTGGLLLLAGYAFISCRRRVE